MLNELEEKSNALVTIMRDQTENSRELQQQLMTSFSSFKERLNKIKLDIGHLLPGFSAPSAGLSVSASILLQLVTLRPTEPLVKRIKAHLEEKIELGQKITSLDKVNALLHSEKDRVNTVDEKVEELDPPKTEVCCKESISTGLAELSPPGPLGQWGHSQKPFSPKASGNL